MQQQQQQLLNPPASAGGSSDLAQQQQNPAALAQMLGGLVAAEVLPLVKAELGASIGPWLADSSASLKRLDTRLAVSVEAGFSVVC